MATTSKRPSRKRAVILPQPRRPWKGVGEYARLEMDRTGTTENEHRMEAAIRLVLSTLRKQDALHIVVNYPHKPEVGLGQYLRRVLKDAR